MSTLNKGTGADLCQGMTTMGEQDQFPGSSGNDGDCKGHDNPPQKTKKIQKGCAETGIDWISQLPDSLIVQILSLIPVVDAFRTTILSKRWQYLWTFIDNLIFGSRNINWSDSLAVNKFISFMDNVLPLLNCSNIKKFSLFLGYHSGMSYNSKLDEWLEIALKNKVEDIDLEIWYYDQESYILPQVLCSSSSVLKLSCTCCRISEDCTLNWTSLKSLTLTHLFLRDEHIEKIISSCPQLESLELQSFCGFHRLHITSPKCRRLQLINHEHHNGDWDQSRGDCYFEVVAPYVQHLKISGDFTYMEIRLGDLSSLIHANLTFYFYDSFRLDELIDRTIVKDHLASLRCANELIVPSWYIEVISMLMLENEDVSLPLLECKQLTITYWSSEYSLLGIETLLRSTPYLENLRIRTEEYCTFKDYWHRDIDLLRHNYCYLQENIFKGSLQNLKNAKVISAFCGSCIQEGDRTELPQLLTSLLERAVNLEKLVIAPVSRICNICPINFSIFIEKLLAFPRASNNAVVSLGQASSVDFFQGVCKVLF